MSGKEKSFSQEILFLRDVLRHKDAEQNAMPLIEGKTPSLIMRGVTNLALKNNVHLVSLAPSGVVEGKEGFYKKATFTAEASAYFKDLGVFLGAIKDADLGIIDINELSVSPSSDNSDADVVKAKIVFVVYVGKNYDRKR